VAKEKTKTFERGRRYELRESVVLPEPFSECRTIEPDKKTAGKTKGEVWPYLERGVVPNEAAGVYLAELHPLPILSIDDCI